MKIKPKELLKNTKIKIIICFVVLIVLVVIGIFAYNKISIMTKENEYADKIYNVISLKYKDKGKYMDKINKQIDNFKKSKVSSKDGINSKLLQIADKAVDENYLLGAGTVLDSCSGKNQFKDSKRAVMYKLAKAYEKTANKENEGYYFAYMWYDDCKDYSDAKEVKKEVAFKYAEECYKNNDYYGAYTYYEYSGKNDKTISDRIKECKYNSIIESLENLYLYDDENLEDEDIKIVKSLGDYKYAKEIYLWAYLHKKAESVQDDAYEIAVNRLKDRLKDPSSYEEDDVDYAVTTLQKSESDGYGEFHITLTIDYYANNSFGAKTSGYFFDTVKIDYIDLLGFSYKKADKIFMCSATEIADDAKKAK